MKAVRGKEFDRTWRSIAACSRELGVCAGSITYSCRTGRAVKGLSFEYVTVSCDNETSGETKTAPALIEPLTVEGFAWGKALGRSRLTPEWILPYADVFLDLAGGPSHGERCDEAEKGLFVLSEIFGLYLHSLDACAALERMSIVLDQHLLVDLIGARGLTRRCGERLIDLAAEIRVAFSDCERLQLLILYRSRARGFYERVRVEAERLKNGGRRG